MLRPPLLLLACLAPLLAVSTASAQLAAPSMEPDEGKVEATIVDADGKPVAGAILFLAWDEPGDSPDAPPKRRESFAGESDETGSVVFAIAPGKRLLRAHTNPDQPIPTASGASLIQTYGPVEIDLRVGETAYPLLAPAGRCEVAIRVKTMSGEPTDSIVALTRKRIEPRDVARLGSAGFDAPGTLAIVRVSADRATIVAGLPAGDVFATAMLLDSRSSPRGGGGAVTLREGGAGQLTLGIDDAPIPSPGDPADGVATP